MIEGEAVREMDGDPFAHFHLTSKAKKMEEVRNVIATGTPSGIGPMTVGDKVDVVIGGIGTLSNTVVAGEG